MRFRRIPNPGEEPLARSEFNSGWRFAVAVGAAVVLLLLVVPLLVLLSTLVKGPL